MCFVSFDGHLANRIVATSISSASSPQKSLKPPHFYATSLSAGSMHPVDIVSQVPSSAIGKIKRVRAILQCSNGKLLESMVMLRSSCAHVQVGRANTSPTLTRPVAKMRRGHAASKNTTPFSSNKQSSSNNKKRPSQLLLSNGRLLTERDKILAVALQQHALQI